MYLRKIPLSEVPTDSDEEIAQFLYDLYQKKVLFSIIYLLSNSYWIPSYISGPTYGILRTERQISWNSCGIPAKNSPTYQLDELVRRYNAFSLL
jgi:hypothetical protein